MLAGMLGFVLCFLPMLLMGTVPAPLQPGGAASSISSTQTVVCTDGQCTTTGTTVSCSDGSCSTQSVDHSAVSEPTPNDLDEVDLPTASHDDT